MKAKRLTLFVAIMASLAATPILYSTAAGAADAPAIQVKEGYYKSLVGYDFVRENVGIPLKKGVMIIDSRPAARQYDPGHIPGAVNIPDSQFDKQAARLPEDKATLLLFYCGGVDCMLSHSSAFKAEKLGYTNIKVYPAGMPEWKAKGAQVSVSAAHVKKLIDEKEKYALIDARPARVTEKGMIPTAINIPDSQFEKNIDKLPADKATTLIFYCGGLECVLSDQSAEKARKLGYTNVLTYPPGHPEWEKLNGGASAGAPVLQAGKEKGSISVASFEKVWKENPTSVLLVDVRHPKEFAAGTIAGAVNMPIQDIDDKMASLPTDKPVIFLCGTGSRAGEAYDEVKKARPAVNASFIDADVKFAGDGTFTMTEKK
jgi:rhodanese-related sulfurtransferase